MSRSREPEKISEWVESRRLMQRPAHNLLHHSEIKRMYPGALITLPENSHRVGCTTAHKERYPDLALRGRLRPGWPQPSPHGWVYGVPRRANPGIADTEVDTLR